MEHFDGRDDDFPLEEEITFDDIADTPTLPVEEKPEPEDKPEAETVSSEDEQDDPEINLADYRTAPTMPDVDPSTTARAVTFDPNGPWKFEPISMHYAPIDVVEKIAGAWAAIPLDSSKREWYDAIRKASETSTMEDAGLGALRRQGSKWTGQPTYEGRSLGPNQPAIKAGGNVNIAGTKALTLMNRMTNSGRDLRVPLWGSGFWLTLAVPTLNESIELDAKMATRRVTLGRATRGELFSNDGVINNSLFIDYVYDHVIDTNVTDMTRELFMELVRLPDLQLLAGYFAGVEYPRGFPFSQPCVSGPDKCTHVSKGTVDIAKMIVVDYERIDEKARKFIAQRNRMRTADEIREYQAGIYHEEASSVEICKGMRMVFKVPSFKDHIDIGEAWVTGIESSTEKAFSSRMTEEERTGYIETQRLATTLMNYAHWVKEIVIDSEDVHGNPVEHIVTDPDTIERQLSTWSRDDEISDIILSGQERFRDASVVAMVAVPNFECPSCRSWLYAEEGPCKAYYPIDAVSAFFQMQQLVLATLTKA